MSENTDKENTENEVPLTKIKGQKKVFFKTIFKNRVQGGAEFM